MKSPGRAWKDWRRSEGFSGRRHFLSTGLMALLVVCGCEFRRPPPVNGSDGRGLSQAPSVEIEDMLHASAASWNEGDLDGYMDDYWKSEDLTFSGATGVTRGWDGLRTRYLEGYWAPGVSRDSLDFQEIEVFELGEDHALALGRYLLFPQDDGESAPATGHFSLVLGKMEGHWRILHDHTSATPAQEGPG